MLLDADDRGIVDVVLLPVLLEVVVNLAGAEDDALGRGVFLCVRDDLPKLAFAEILKRRGAARVTEQTLGRHYDERLVERPVNLPSQCVEQVGRGGEVADLDIVLGARLQEALQPAARVFRSLSLIAVRQQQHDVGGLVPLALGGGDKLVDDHLRAVGEVAKLRLPQQQHVGVVQRVAEFETQHRGLGQRAIVDAEIGLLRREFAERQIAAASAHLVVHRMPVAERAASDVLPGEAHRDVLGQKCAEGQRLGHAPVERPFALDHLAALLDQALNLRIERELIRFGCQRHAHFAKPLEGDCGVSRIEHLRRRELRPDGRL